MFGFHVTPDNLIVLVLLIITATCLGALIIDYPDPQPVKASERKGEAAKLGTGVVTPL